MAPARRGRPTRTQDVVEGRLGVVSLAVPLDDLEGIDGADVEARAQSVAIDLPDEDSFILAVQGQGPFGAGRRAQAAAVAFVAVDLDDQSFGHDSLLLWNPYYYTRRQK